MDEWLDNEALPGAAACQLEPAAMASLEVLAVVGREIDRRTPVHDVRGDYSERVCRRLAGTHHGP